MKKCSKCNTYNSDEAKFCRSCGKMLDDFSTNSNSNNSQSSTDNGLSDGAKIFLGFLCVAGMIASIGLFWAGSISRAIAFPCAMACGMGLRQLFKD